MVRESLARHSACLCALVLCAGMARTETADEVSKLIERLHDLNSIDLCKFEVKFRAGLEPSLAAVDADESGMKPLKNPLETQGQDKPAAAGWYRVSFVIPEQFSKLHPGATWVIESNVLGAWEIYGYRNGALTVFDHGLLTRSSQPANAWIRSALKDAKSGDRMTLVILATSYPWGGGSPDGFALRHLRFGKRTSESFGVFFDALVRVRDKLRTLEGDELKVLQEKVKGPLAGIDSIFAAAETGKGSVFMDALVKATKPLSDALKK